MSAFTKAVDEALTTLILSMATLQLYIDMQRKLVASTWTDWKKMVAKQSQLLDELTTGQCSPERRQVIGEQLELLSENILDQHLRLDVQLEYFECELTLRSKLLADLMWYQVKKSAIDILRALCPTANINGNLTHLPNVVNFGHFQEQLKEKWRAQLLPQPPRIRICGQNGKGTGGRERRARMLG